MHELSMCEDVVAAVEQRAGGRSVARVGVRAGTLHRIVPAAFEQSFRMAAVGSVADGAQVDLLIVPVHGWCYDCQLGYETQDALAFCPRCGGTSVTLAGGDELLVEWIEYR